MSPVDAATAPATGAVGPTVGVPREVKDNEDRVAITPEGVRELTLAGVTVLVEAGAGEGSSIGDREYRAAGAVLTDADAVWADATLVCKVKEPQPGEYPRLRPGLVLFTYLHLAAYPAVADALLAASVTGIAYETVQVDGGLPLLAPMSEIAGRMASQVGAHLLERPRGGRGVLLGGAPGVRPGRVVVLGAGHVGCAAAAIATGMGAEVVLVDRDLERLRRVDRLERGRVSTLASNRTSVERVVAEADLVIGAVLVPGGRAPVVVTDDMVDGMRPRSVIVDVAIDQGGCVEGIRETTHAAPVFERREVLHYAVGNIPGAVPHTSTYALTNATLPYLLRLATTDLVDACAADPGLALGVNTLGGSVTNATVAAALGVGHRPLAAALAGPSA